MSLYLLARDVIIFGAHTQRQFGKVEVDDQVMALKAAACTVDYIDLNRVAVTGWSYGEWCVVI